MLNAAHFHLIINHVPVIGTAITIFVLLIGILKKSDEIKKVSIMILILTAVITIPVYLSGDKAQEMIEGNYDDVDESFIEAHEDFAFNSFIAMNITAVVGLAGLFLYRRPKTLPNTFVYFLFALLIVVKVMMAYTGNLGGKIHHPEIRIDKMPWESSSTQNNNSDNKNDKSGKENKKDKDDDDE